MTPQELLQKLYDPTLDDISISFHLEEYCDEHEADNNLDNENSIYAAARLQLQNLRTYLQTGDDLDTDEILLYAKTLHAIDHFILDNSR